MCRHRCPVGKPGCVDRRGRARVDSPLRRGPRLALLLSGISWEHGLSRRQQRDAAGALFSRCLWEPNRLRCSPRSADWLGLARYRLACIYQLLLGWTLDSIISLPLERRHPELTDPSRWVRFSSIRDLAERKNFSRAFMGAGCADQLWHTCGAVCGRARWDDLASREMDCVLAVLWHLGLFYGSAGRVGNRQGAPGAETFRVTE